MAHRVLPPLATVVLLLAGIAGCGGATAPPADPAAAAPADEPAPGAAEGTTSDADPGGDAAGAPPATTADGPAAAPGVEAAPAGEPAPKASAMDLGGTLSPAQVAKFVEDHQDYFDPCIEIAEKGGKVYKVSITTRVYVGPRGRVNKTEVTKTTSKDEAFKACVTGAFEKIAFGKPKDGATATIVFPMTFSGEVQ